MNELDKVLRAKMYMEKLADGIDPLTDIQMQEDTTLNNVRLARCFFYVADILRKVAENGGEVGRRPIMRPARDTFSITPEQAAGIRLSETPVTISRFCDMVSEASGNPGMRKLNYRAVTDWLADRNYLRVEETPAGKRKRVGDFAAQIGIFEETRSGQYGEYIVILYGKEAQRFMLEHIDDIIASGAGVPEPEQDRFNMGPN